MTSLQINLQNASISLDGNILSTLLAEFLNLADGKTEVDLPNFRVTELLNVCSQKFNISSEMKMSESAAAIYILCFYFSLTTNYELRPLMQFTSLIQALMCEALITLQTCGPHRLIMPNIFETLKRNENIETEYLVEIFIESLLIAQNLGRNLLNRLRLTIRQFNAPKNKSKPNKQRNSLTYEDVIDAFAPHSIYFLCSFALSNITANLQKNNNVNFIPGILESLTVMVLTKSAHFEQKQQIISESENRINTAATALDGNRKGSKSSVTPIANDSNATASANTSANSKNVALTSASVKALPSITEAKNLSNQTAARPSSSASTGTAATATTALMKPATPGTMAAQRQAHFNLLINTVNKLAVFIAHLVMDERTLQEVRLVRGRLVRSLTHQAVIVAQFHTSTIKTILASHKEIHTADPLPKAKNNGNGTANGTSQGRRKTAVEVGAATKTNTTATAGKLDTATNNAINHILNNTPGMRKPSTAQSAVGNLVLPSLQVADYWNHEENNKLNIHSAGFYFFNEASSIPWSYLVNPDQPDNHSLFNETDHSVAGSVSVSGSASGVAGAVTGNSVAGGSRNGGILHQDSLSLPPLGSSRESGRHHNAGDVTDRSSKSNATTHNDVHNKYNGRRPSTAISEGDMESEGASVATGGQSAYSASKQRKQSTSGMDNRRMSSSASHHTGHSQHSGRGLQEGSFLDDGSMTSSKGTEGRLHSSHQQYNNTAHSAHHNNTNAASDNHSLTSGRRMSQSGLLSTGLHNTAGANGASNAAQTAGTGVPSDQKLKQFWAPQAKPFRSLFLTLDNLPSKAKRTSIAAQFSAEYVPAKCNAIPSIEIEQKIDLLDMKGISEYPVTETVKFVENQYFKYSDMFYFPRILNPSEEIYWICSYVIDYLHKQTLAGGGFHPSATDEMKELKLRIKAMKQQHKDMESNSINTNNPMHNSINNDMRMLSQSLDLTSHKQKNNSKQNMSTNVSNGQPKSQKKPQAVLSLAEKLSLAAMEASVESKLYEMERKMYLAQHPELAVRNTELDALHKLLADNLPQGTTTTETAASVTLDRPTTAGNKKSVVWHCKPKVIFVRKQDFEGYDAEAEALKDNPLLGLPSRKESLEYAAQLAEIHKQEKEAEERRKLQLLDSGENILSNIRTAKALKLQTIRAKIKDDMTAKVEFKVHLEEMTKKKAAEDKQERLRESKAKKDAEFREKMRIKEIRMEKEMEAKREEMKHQTEIALQQHKIREMADKKEALEIIRRAQEEARMKYLEERRRVVERRKEEENMRIKQIQDEKVAKTGEVRDKLQGRVRMGNFVWHNGVYGFYDNVQKEAIGWVQYEDESGVPYYYDPKNNITQYRMPADADIRHYTVDERIAYDTEYGEGAYDLMKADRAFKDGVNQYGGYYNDNGEWETANGYYNENYEWVQYEGYFNDDGKYIKYAKASGNLNFMV